VSGLADKVVVVTGSTRGIGRGIARACAVAGATVVLSSRKTVDVQAAVTELESAGLRASGVECDVRRGEDIARLLDHAIETHGRVDVWFNNAGVSSGYRPLDEIPASDLSCVVDTNLLGTMLACRLLVPYFAENGGILVNLSGRGARGDATPYTAAYAATKAAVLSLTRSLAAENRRHRRVSIHALLPGMVDTDFYGPDMKVSPLLEESAPNIRLVLDAIGVPVEDVGRLAAEVAAQEPGRITGRVYSAAGGPRMIRGIAKMTWWQTTGKMTSEP
jgi:NAD(P)-dependent dehydrogenase (short-subunit alcohol dehydrogenase family)